MAIKSETRLGPYEIVSAIGAGGMGEVYRARDPRLKREVAIKVLPASFSSDPQRLHRFEQEAIAAGSLNHPNILAVHDIGTQDGSPYIVSELLDGATLRERLRSGPLPIRKAVDYAQQIASGLAAAHSDMGPTSSRQLVLRGPPGGGSVPRWIHWSGSSAWLAFRLRCLSRYSL